MADEQRQDVASCPGCDVFEDQPHTTECPLLRDGEENVQVFHAEQTKRHVAWVLSAARALVDVGPPIHADASPFPGGCAYCGADVEESPFRSDPPIRHSDDCPWNQLRQAVNG